MVNLAVVSEFLLQGFSEVWELQLFHAALFLLVYLVAKMENLLIVPITALDRRHPHSHVSFVIVFDGTEPFCWSYVIAQFFCDVPSVIRLSRSKTYAAFKTSSSSFGLDLPVSMFYTMTEFPLMGFTEVRELQLVQATLLLLVFRAALMGNPLIIAITTLIRQLHTSIYFFLRNRYDIVLARGACGKMATASWNSGGLIFIYVKSPEDSSFIVDLLVSVFYMVVAPSMNLLIYRLRNQNMNAAMGRIQKGSLRNHVNRESQCGIPKMSNVSTVMGFFLLDFLEIWELHLVMTVFLLVYLEPFRRIS
ncbi:olfactory receptor 14J1-like [Tachyglossus aculeatus]|uniref:olfactory receptor 14J1-like n=1 Tax=Tachyglossus aculeatus TaxID=9261 RepID=UPI0018F6982A|nr:olfactory receptor 14J1-like [Tachyglossus aculeatus]